MRNEHFKVFSDCKIVDGHKRSVLVDLTREKYFIIPKYLSFILQKFDGKKKKDVIKDLTIEDQQIIEEYFDFLEQNEIIFWCNKSDISKFPDLNLDWDWPAPITNAIIDINEKSNHEFGIIFRELQDLNCQDIQIRSYAIKTIYYWNELLELLISSRVKNIEIITPWYEEADEQSIVKLLTKHLRLKSLIFHSAPTRNIMTFENSESGVFATITDEITSNTHCGQVHWDYFSVNVKLFTESQKYNTCLNRKISIDVDGEIKNCPSMAKSYGNIKTTQLKDVLNMGGFKDLWLVNKNQISVCKDCEFRHICTDCRVFLSSSDDSLSKPSKCNYNPYTAEWENTTMHSE